MAQKFDVAKFADEQAEKYDWYHEVHPYSDEYEEMIDDELDKFIKDLEMEAKAKMREEEKGPVVIYEKITEKEKITERQYVIGKETSKEQTLKNELRASQEQQKKEVQKNNWLDSFKPKTVTKTTQKKGMER